MSLFYAKPKFYRAGIIVTGLLLVFIAIQFYRPDIKSPVVQPSLTAPPEIAAIFKRSCYDCHSYETKLRWYDQLAPVYWQVARDINKAREGLNFSTWNSLAKPERKAKLWESLNQVHAAAMPLKIYLYMHPSAKLSTTEIESLRLYLLATRNDHGGDTAKTPTYLQQISGKQQLKEVNHQASPNGIKFIPEYWQWQLISTTERYDNGTLRFIYANPIAVNAIQHHQTNPWPDGSIFAKIAWEQRGTKADTRAGAFKQIEFMIKNSSRYQATLGWGWARFKTLKLLPYGKTALFTTECMNCHRPMKDQDFVFTPPVIR
ncbi:MAG: heme-binding domain-containing protein [Bacteroidota bacterium]